MSVGVASLLLIAAGFVVIVIDILLPPDDPARADLATRGRRRIDIAHALLHMVGTEIAAVAASPAEAKHHGQLVAKQLKAFVREKFDERQRRAGAP